MWSVAPLNTTAIRSAGAWLDIADMTLSLSLPNTTSVIVSYGVSVVADKPTHPGGDFLNDAGLEASGLGDFLGARLTIDGVPYRQSGSHVSALGSMERSARQLRGHMVLPLQGGNHTVKLQWRKWGRFVRSWSTRYGVLHSALHSVCVGVAGCRALLMVVDVCCAAASLKMGSWPAAICLPAQRTTQCLQRSH